MINLRIFEGVEWPDKVKPGEKCIVIRKGSWKTFEPMYVVPA